MSERQNYFTSAVSKISTDFYCNTLWSDISAIMREDSSDFLHKTDLSHIFFTHPFTPSPLSVFKITAVLSPLSYQCLSRIAMALAVYSLHPFHRVSFDPSDHRIPNTIHFRHRCRTGSIHRWYRNQFWSTRGHLGRRDRRLSDRRSVWYEP